MSSASRPVVLDRVRALNYLVFDGGPWDMNLIVVRSADTTPNRFDDKLYVVYRNQSGYWAEHVFPCTADPGLFWLKFPERVDGTAIVAPGQHRSVLELGKHKGEYTALCQRDSAVIPVYRDRNKDGKLDRSGILYTNAKGINVHRANPNAESTVVDRWSAGCIVLPDPWDFAYMVSLVKRSMERWGPYVTLTVLQD